MGCVTTRDFWPPGIDGDPDERIRNSYATEGDTVSIPVSDILPSDSPRLNGEDDEHVERLARIETPLPPILVDRRSMRVIDGMHRLLVASRKKQESIDVVFFDGSTAEAFLRAVEANVTHGLPLSKVDRNAAAERIIASHPHMSDRAIATSAGLSARTVARIRQRVTTGAADIVARVGRDGKVRPLNSADGRTRAARLIAENPRASLREIARGAGVSPETVRDVRMRLTRGEKPTALRRDASTKAGRNTAEAPDGVLEKLLRDPSLRHNEAGRHLLRLLQLHTNGRPSGDWMISAVPPHCVPLVASLARHCGRMWLEFAQALRDREQDQTG